MGEKRVIVVNVMGKFPLCSFCLTCLNNFTFIFGNKFTWSTISRWICLIMYSHFIFRCKGFQTVWIYFYNVNNDWLWVFFFVCFFFFFFNRICACTYYIPLQKITEFSFRKDKDDFPASFINKKCLGKCPRFNHLVYVRSQQDLWRSWAKPDRLHCCKSQSQSIMLFGFSCSRFNAFTLKNLYVQVASADDLTLHFHQLEFLNQSVFDYRICTKC